MLLAPFDLQRRAYRWLDLAQIRCQLETVAPRLQSQRQSLVEGTRLVESEDEGCHETIGLVVIRDAQSTTTGAHVARVQVRMRKLPHR